MKTKEQVIKSLLRRSCSLSNKEQCLDNLKILESLGVIKYYEPVFDRKEISALNKLFDRPKKEILDIYYTCKYIMDNNLNIKFIDTRTKKQAFKKVKLDQFLGDMAHFELLRRGYNV